MRFTTTLKQVKCILHLALRTQSNLGDRLFIGTGSVDSNGDATSIDVIGKIFCRFK